MSGGWHSQGSNSKGRNCVRHRRPKLTGAQERLWLFPLDSLFPGLKKEGAAEATQCFFIFVCTNTIFYKYLRLSFIIAFYCWLDQSQTQPPSLTFLHDVTLSSIYPRHSCWLPSSRMSVIFFTHSTYFQFFNLMLSLPKAMLSLGPNLIFHK